MFNYKLVLEYVFLSSEYATDEDEYDVFYAMLDYMLPDGSLDMDKLHRHAVVLEVPDAIS